MIILPEETTYKQEDKLRRDLLIFACAFMNLAVVLWLAIYWVMGLHFSANVPLIYQLVSVASLVHFLKTRRFEVFRFVQLSLFLFVPFIMQWSIGSAVTSSGVMLWALLAPIGALVVSGWRDSIPWFIAYIVMTVVSGFFDYYLGSAGDTGLSMKTIGFFFALNFAAMSSILYFLVRYFVVEMDNIKNQLDQQHQLLAEEQKNSERVLLNVLPNSIAQRLKNKAGLIADGHADVTVMFADLVNFTQLTESLSPEQMVGLLNTIFSIFDNLCEEHGVEKIKTIGDAYMVVGGLNRDNVNYTSDIADLALEMRQVVNSHPDLSRFKLGIHTGIATGPVVAGVIGTKRFIYDLWGDTVNVASRLTDEAVQDVIQVDRMTYNRIRHEYAFEPPATVHVKGKGEMVMYRLTARLGDNKRQSNFSGSASSNPFQSVSGQLSS
ncbi:MAG: adenylate/guanylate cyclase domain-containing protein [Nitrosomonadales bacterium]|nr:adenylate/guanylate cyclase domain-containing protein [Nitrosomonadales bacterium]